MLRSRTQLSSGNFITVRPDCRHLDDACKEPLTAEDAEFALQCRGPPISSQPFLIVETRNITSGEPDQHYGHPRNTKPAANVEQFVAAENCRPAQNHQV